QLISYFLKTFVKTGSGVLTPMEEYGLPVLFGHQYLLNIIIVAVLTVVVYVYLKSTKQGYEIAVVGESENTANYIGINVKKVVIRTLIVSGALCGIAGLLLVGGTNHTINTETAGGRGFTAIMVSWLAKFNPIFMVFTSFLIVFLQKGSQQVSTDFRLPQAISDIVTGIILFFIIGCEFFLNYKIVISKNGKENA
ncbi:MAG: ABC transporter permease, partial [Oscillospiraceae bacterium]|nr:ABC transporter permease [Oscillospiraceae bacterium]